MDNSIYTRHLVVLLLMVMILIVSGCVQSQNIPQDNSQSASEQGRSPTASKECPSVYDGTYQGIFTYDYEVFEEGEVIRTGTDGVRLSLTLKCVRVDEDNGEVYLDATNVIASHPYFECQVGGCVPPEYEEMDYVGIQHEALLPLNPPTTASKPSKMGEGILIYFPNGAYIITNNAEGDLHVGFDGQVLSNSLTGGNTWVAGKSAVIDPFPGEGDQSGTYYTTSFKSWTLSKTT